LLTPRMRRDQIVPEGGVTPGGKFAGGLPIPSRPRWSDICDGPSDDEIDEAGQQQEPDASPKSPSKSARRANRRRRCREAARAAVAEVAEFASEDPFSLGGGTCSGTPVGGQRKTMLPARAFLNVALLGAMPGGNCTPTCVASPIRGSPVRGGPLSLPAEADAACSPTRSSISVMSTAPQAQSVIGDASTRTPTAGTCTSAFLCGPVAGSDASARTVGARLLLAPTAGPWSVLGSPSGGSLTTAPSIVSTSPMAASATRPSLATAACGPAGSAAADALRCLLGPGGMAAGDELAARLRAAAPEMYED